MVYIFNTFFFYLSENLLNSLIWFSDFPSVIWSDNASVRLLVNGIIVTKIKENTSIKKLRLQVPQAKIIWFKDYSIVFSFGSVTAQVFFIFSFQYTCIYFSGAFLSMVDLEERFFTHQYYKAFLFCCYKIENGKQKCGGIKHVFFISQPFPYIIGRCRNNKHTTIRKLKLN